MYKAGYGQHDANWLAFYEYMRSIGVTGVERLDGLNQLARHAGWWWPFAGAVILTPRPTTLSRDGDGRLHCETGPAIAYPDGWALHSWHGVRIPRELVEDPVESWTVERILRLDNSEIRRAAIERIGWERLESQLGAPVHIAPDPANAPNELRLYDVPADLYEDAVRLVCMTNASPDKDGTVRRYGETVPAWIDDAVEASAWAWDVPVDVYRQLQRAT